jgi:hypothetical protein
MFKGFLSIFLLDMGIVSGRKLQDFFKSGWFAVLLQLLSLITERMYSCTCTQQILLVIALCILAASASYIAVPAALKIAVPKANPGLYLQWH